MSITHDTCRDTVAAGAPVDDATQAHLAGCGSCRSFAADVADLDRRAAATAPDTAPAGLADRVVAAIPLEGAPAAVPLTRRLRRPVAVAAATLLVAAGVSSLAGRGGEEEPRRVLLAAANHFEDDGGSQVTVDAVTEVEVPANGRDPDFSQAPPEVRDYMAVQWNHIMAELDRRLAELGQQIDDLLASVPGSPPPPPSRHPRERRDPEAGAPAPPESASLSVRIRAAGAVDPSAGVQLEGNVAASPGTIDVSQSTAAFAIDASSDRGAALHGPDGAWVQTQAGSGPLGRILLDSRSLPEILRAAEGDIRSGAAVTIGDGERGRRYTFRVPASAVGGGPARWTASVVVDDNDRVRQVVLGPSRSGRDSTIRTRVTVDIGGRAAFDPSRSPARVGAGAGVDASSPFASVSPAVRAAVKGSAR